jgi:selenocysteine lyase/cysteine desulfurase
MQDLSRFGAASFLAYAGQRERLRQGLAELLDVRPQDVALTPGTTRGISDVALGLPLREADEIVLLEGEFPANVVPWSIAARAANARVCRLPIPDPLREDGAGQLLERVEARLRQGARFVSVSAVEFQTGLKLPTAELGALCRTHGAHLLVDGIQCVGPVPLSPAAEGVSALIGGAHKWLLGSEGAGFVYLSEELRRELSVKTLGWLSFEGGERFLFEGAGLLRYDLPVKDSALQLEGSTAQLLPFVAMEAGVALIRALGPQAIFDHVQRYHDAMEPRIVELGFRSLRAPLGGRSAILSFEPPAGLSLQEFSAALRRRKVMVSTPDGLLRLAPHFSNALSEVEEVASAAREAMAEVRS